MPSTPLLWHFQSRAPFSFQARGFFSSRRLSAKPKVRIELMTAWGAPPPGEIVC